MWLTCFYRLIEDDVILYVDRLNICLCLRDVELEKASSNFLARGGPFLQWGSYLVWCKCTKIDYRDFEFDRDSR